MRRKMNRSSHSRRLWSINIIAGVSSQGNFYFSINKGKTNSWSFLLFMTKLVQHLNAKNQMWRSSTVIMMDNAPYHRSAFVRQKLEDLKVPIMFLGPYHFRLAPIELFFSYIKQMDLNPLNTIITSQ
jgi:transposase